MRGYAVRRILQAVPTLVISSVLVFSILHLLPGDPALIVAGADARPEQVQVLREQMGLDRPLVVQYGLWIGRVVQGDLGNSYINKFPVRDLILQKLPATLHLTVGALVVALLISVPAGIYSATHRRSALARAASAFASLGLAVPTFWLGILLVLLFALKFRDLGLPTLPASGFVPLTDGPGRALQHLLLPSVTLGVAIAAVLTRFIRSAVLEVLGHDYVRTARAKGLRERIVVGRHVVRNALIPVVTVLGLQIGTLLGGAVVTESIFDFNGVGKLLLTSVLNKDYSVVQAVVLFVVTIFVAINLITDLAYALLDPRIHYGSAR